MPTTAAVACPAEQRAAPEGSRPGAARAVVLAVAYMAVMLVATLAGAAWAGEAGAPRGRVVLTVTGLVGDAGRGGAPAEFTLDGLERLGTVELETETPFTPGPVRFTGVPLRTLLEAVGARGDSIRATALNDYAVDLPLDETNRRHALLATRIDGKPMPVRDKGPVWIVFPWRTNPEFGSPLHAARSIWQLRSIEVR